MEEVRFSKKNDDSVEMSDLEGSTNGSYSTGSPSRSKEYSNDPVADSLLGFYRALNLEDTESLRYILLASPLLLIAFFYIFISQSTSSMISFSAFIMSIVFMGISAVMLCEILKKDVGPKSMQDIAQTIREGSEGFFVT